ncbi:MAG TPA: hypothetical protein VJ723_04940 [Candidatus Angelobacter sp.]|nr:hypothetical protein [Candidatus Angelobacter sp.]
MGTNEADVKKYLDSRRLKYNFVDEYGGSDLDAYVIDIGEEPGGLRCEDWNVFAALVFDSAKTLRGIRLDKQGACG